MKKNCCLFIVLLSLSACYIPHWDDSNYTRFQVSMEYDYGDVVYTSIGSCSTRPRPTSGGYFHFNTFAPYDFDASVGYLFNIDAVNLDNNDISIWGELSQGGKFEFNHKYFADFIPNQIETKYINKDGIAIPENNLNYRLYLDKLWYIFLPPSDEEFAFSLQFGGEALDWSCLPDSVYVNVRGQIDIYKKYFEDKGYNEWWEDYTEYIH